MRCHHRMYKKMETFIELKEFVENSHYQMQKQKIHSDLTDKMIDMPNTDFINMIEIIKADNRHFSNVRWIIINKSNKQSKPVIWKR